VKAKRIAGIETNIVNKLSIFLSYHKILCDWYYIINIALRPMVLRL